MLAIARFNSPGCRALAVTSKPENNRMAGSRHWPASSEFILCPVSFTLVGQMTALQRMAGLRNCGATLPPPVPRSAKGRDRWPFQRGQTNAAVPLMSRRSPNSLTKRHTSLDAEGLKRTLTPRGSALARQSGRDLQPRTAFRTQAQLDNWKSLGLRPKRSERSKRGRKRGVSRPINGPRLWASAGQI
ncbi:hypothetical protein POI8812_01017 [Pontivivens insulae]|uniref:Uncharacterized protein n=1 Tax=Pontivivens insulae TaxID=1639689 RepID=A0A2R8A912_9RHOB|nr:hypothetical protein DFR53_1016 [Pontivivens insulae]SPF28714.1 hypothetical protein POI8812_01017 [Pontivivens insulae]